MPSEKNRIRLCFFILLWIILIQIYAFLDGKKVNFSTTGLQNERLTEADAILYKISLDIRHEV